MNLKVAIVGGREFNNYELLCEKMDHYLKNKKPYVSIVCGMAKGADTLGHSYGINNDFEILEFPADWDNLGKSAGPVRNIKMAEEADAVVAFWDGRSKGTLHMINQTKKLNKPIKIIKYHVEHVNNYSYICHEEKDR